MEPSGDDTSMTSRDRGPGVRFPPPTLFVAGFALAWALHRWLLPFEIDDDGAGTIQTLVGAAGMAAGLILMAWGIITFVRHRTAILPHSPARTLVEAGPYRFTRNPMYVGLTLAYVGLSIVLNLVWPIVVLPLVLAALVRFVVRREERHLTEKFGDAYADYRRRVRRWV
jgi:protein-S-isoprenylcysteine O-methyltransferase Ste14